MRRLYEASAWGPNGVKVEDWRFRGIFRWVLPLADILFIWFGASGWYYGIQSVQLAASPAWQTFWSAALALAAFVALIGVSFPRLWLVELVAKIPLIALLSVYVFILGERATHNPEVAPTAGLVVVLFLALLWRVGDLATPLGKALRANRIVGVIMRKIRSMSR